MNSTTNLEHHFPRNTPSSRSQFNRIWGHCLDYTLAQDKALPSPLLGVKNKTELLRSSLPLFSATSLSLVTKQESPHQVSCQPVSLAPTQPRSPAVPSLYISLLWITFHVKATAQQREAVRDSKSWNVLLIMEQPYFVSENGTRFHSFSPEQYVQAYTSWAGTE